MQTTACFVRFCAFSALLVDLVDASLSLSPCAVDSLRKFDELAHALLCSCCLLTHNRLISALSLPQCASLCRQVFKSARSVRISLRYSSKPTLYDRGWPYKGLIFGPIQYLRRRRNFKGLFSFLSIFSELLFVVVFGVEAEAEAV